jgi:ABC-type transport system involved in multi-copper enzyme maturation permease subunit
LLKRFPRWLGVSLLALGTLLSSGLILWCSLAPGITARTVLNQLVNLQVQQLAGAFMPADYGFWWQGIVALLFFSLLAGIRCSGSISGERERQTWEALLLTPLTEQELIRGKLWGIMGVSYGCVLAYAVPAVALSFLGGPGAIFWTMVWLLVTFLAMFYTGSAGMWSSVRSRSSWRSLLSTLGWGYVGGFIVFLCTVPIILYLVLFILIALELLDHLLGTSFSPNTGTGFAQVLVVTSLAVCIGLALLFWGGSRFFLHYAQKWVAERERTRFWQDEPRMPHRRRCLARLR